MKKVLLAMVMVIVMVGLASADMVGTWMCAEQGGIFAIDIASDGHIYTPRMGMDLGTWTVTGNIIMFFDPTIDRVHPNGTMSEGLVTPDENTIYISGTTCLRQIDSARF